MNQINASIFAGTIALTTGSMTSAAGTGFGPANPFYTPGALPFHAPPFDRIKDEDYQPAIEAGMAQQLAEIRRIADNTAPPTLENTFVAMERSGRLLDRAQAAFRGVSDANTNPTLQSAKSALAPKSAAHEDAIHLDAKLFERIAAVYRERGKLKLDRNRCAWSKSSMPSSFTPAQTFRTPIRRSSKSSTRRPRRYRMRFQRNFWRRPRIPPTRLRIEPRSRA